MKIIVLTRIYTVKYILLAMSGEGQPVWLYNTSSRTLGHVTSVFVNIYAFPLRRILYWSITVSPEVTLSSSRKEFCSFCATVVMKSKTDLSKPSADKTETIYKSKYS